MKKAKKQTLRVEKSKLVVKKQSNQYQVLSADEKTKKITELKIRTKEKQLAELKKTAAEKEIILDESDEVFVPLNEEEKEMVSQWRERVKNSQKSPVVFAQRTKANGKKDLSIETVDGYPISVKDKFEIWSTALNLATGSTDYNFSYLLFKSCQSASLTFNKDDQSNSTALMNALTALKPQDEFEGMLITRLIALHFQSMEYLGRASNNEATTQVIDNNINRTTKLSRLYNETLEALMRYRRKGEQKVMVQHQYVQVNDGGNAVIGQVGGGGNNKTAEVPHGYSSNL